MANLAGRFWSVVSIVVFLPFYLRLLGAEAFGLIGVYATLLGILAVSDLGLTATLNREMARLSAGGEANGQRDTVRSFETVYAVIVIVLTGLVILAAPTIAYEWVHVQGVPRDSVQNAVRLMGVALAGQLAFSLYVGALIGLQRQVVLNVIQITMGLARGLGALVVLWEVANTIEAYFVWQVVVNLAQLVWIRRTVWDSLPASQRAPRFDWQILRGVGPYAAGMAGMTLTSSILMQTDKVILSKLLPLGVFGYYTIAWSASQLPVNALSNPVYQAVFPPLTQHVVREAWGDVKRLYHASCQVVAVLVLPVTTVLILFSREILLVWLGEPEAVAGAYRLLALLTVGMGLTGLLVMPYGLQLAHGWTKLSVSANSVAIVVFVPLLLILTDHYGAVGAGISWIALNAGYMIVVVGIMHRYILIGEQWSWLVHDVLIPLGAAAAPVIVLRQVFPDLANRVHLLVGITAVWIVAVLFTVAVTPAPRQFALGFIRQRWSASGKRGTPTPTRGL